jgi:peptide chain release factor 2
VFKEQSQIKDRLDGFERLRSALEEARLFFTMAQEEGAEDSEAARETRRALAAAEAELKRQELAVMLGGEYDRLGAIVSIQAGAGGTEAQDWADMLLRLYLRWAERHGYKVELADLQPGEGAGIKSATFTVEGDYAYGYLRAEAGIHRLVRISPFDASARRHTSFASVFVLPAIDDKVEVIVNPADLRIDTFRASGAGGQHVNKTDSAVRMTHIPSGIVVSCQNERSQHKNRAMAMKILRARLFELEERKKREQLEQFTKEKKEIAWGSQIRSYVLQPYRMVKDHRTGVEVGNTDAVLDGDIDQFIEAFLMGVRKEGAEEGQMSSVLSPDQMAQWLRTAFHELSGIEAALTNSRQDAVQGPGAEQELRSLIDMVGNLEPCRSPAVPPLGGRPPQTLQLRKLTPDLAEAIHLRPEDRGLLASDIIAFDPSRQLSQGAESIIRRLEQDDAALAKRARVAFAKLALLRNRLQVPAN